MATEDIRIYVACLAAYNAGTLHGRWIDATLGVDHINEEVQAMLEESPEPGAEEWAIHDYEGFGDLRLSEQESFDTVATLAEAIEEHGEAFIAFVNHHGTKYGTVERFQDSYRGEFSSVEDYAEELINDCYNVKAIGELANYIDYEKFAHDLECNGDIFTVDGGKGVYVFDNNVSTSSQPSGYA